MRMRVYIFISIIFTVNLASFGLFFFLGATKDLFSSDAAAAFPFFSFRIECSDW